MLLKCQQFRSQSKFLLSKQVHLSHLLLYLLGAIVDVLYTSVESERSEAASATRHDSVDVGYVSLVTQTSRVTPRTVKNLTRVAIAINQSSTTVSTNSRCNDLIDSQMPFPYQHYQFKPFPRGLLVIRFLPPFLPCLVHLVGYLRFAPSFPFAPITTIFPSIVISKFYKALSPSVRYVTPLLVWRNLAFAVQSVCGFSTIEKPGVSIDVLTTVPGRPILCTRFCFELCQEFLW